MFDYAYQVLKKIITDSDPSIQVDLYNNQMSKFGTEGGPYKLPSTLLDFKASSFDFSKNKPCMLDAEFSIFYVSKMIDPDLETAASNHLKMIDKISHAFSSISKNKLSSEVASEETLVNKYSYAELLGLTGDPYEEKDDFVIRRIESEGKIDTARTKDFAYENLRITAIDYKAIINFVPGSSKFKTENIKGFNVNHDFNFQGVDEKGDSIHDTKTHKVGEPEAPNTDQDA